MLALKYSFRVEAFALVVKSATLLIEFNTWKLPPVTETQVLNVSKFTEPDVSVTNGVPSVIALVTLRWDFYSKKKK